ncbi:helix-turn-helix domain-containing protein [Virgibacillus sp. NKC19-3]|uniref:helix-turn-helix domain-containing protein n=1 Tax=Virgibacillus saliphilus TaxID=2831674 RepID=UPI001C9B6ABC|nr:helix-turn-helix domain-containing protein [Virgibacillus sp. NKC19-3]MBY7144059.1 helix-turn-helix domain-containing protein [Virgibacillus sp. NKC19-3]
MNNHDTLRELLGHLMEEKALSIRKLGKISGIDHATISKIMHGKRKINIAHLQKLSRSLDVELMTLMEAAGYTTEFNKKKDVEIQDSIEMIQKILKTTNTYDGAFTLEQIEQEIAYYQNYSQSDEGRETILQEFQAKLDKTGALGPYIVKLRVMFSRFCTKQGTIRELTLMGAALLYFIITTDLLPDYLLPIGFLDDALIIQVISQHIESKKGFSVLEG